MGEELQRILGGVVPAWFGLWQPESEDDVPPAQYAVYEIVKNDALWADDRPAFVHVQANVGLWSVGNPEETAAMVVEAMRAEGWSVAK